VIALNFHRVETPTGFEINRLSPKRFDQVMDAVEDEIRESAANESDPEHRLKAIITFDDGFASIGEYALPELLRRNSNAGIFLISKFVGRDDSWDFRVLGRKRPMMSWQQAREWASYGFVFGSHTRTHRDLTALAPAALKRELEDSKREIEDGVGKEVTMLSYPFGRHNQRVRDAVRDAGYNCAYGLLRKVEGPFDIPRLNLHALMRISELRRIMRGMALPSWPSKVFATLSAGSATLGNWRRSTTQLESPVAARALVSKD
jgi:peptidoglycan/xylan/chitin deacetylase (PgdA/CDA1 family)